VCTRKVSAARAARDAAAAAEERERVAASQREHKVQEQRTERSFDWAQLGLTAATATITVNAFAGFGHQMVVDSSSAALLIPGGQGFLLDVRLKA